jgi:hypothetical protein
MVSAEFLERANAAVTKAVQELEAKGIKPAYANRSSVRAVTGSDNASHKKRSCEESGVPDILKTEIEDSQTGRMNE